MSEVEARLRWSLLFLSFPIFNPLLGSDDCLGWGFWNLPLNESNLCKNIKSVPDAVRYPNFHLVSCLGKWEILQLSAISPRVLLWRFLVPRAVPCVLCSEKMPSSTCTEVTLLARFLPVTKVNFLQKVLIFSFSRWIIASIFLALLLHLHVAQQPWLCCWDVCINTSNHGVSSELQYCSFLKKSFTESSFMRFLMLHCHIPDLKLEKWLVHLASFYPQQWFREYGILHDLILRHIFLTCLMYDSCR